MFVVVKATAKAKATAATNATKLAISAANTPANDDEAAAGAEEKWRASQRCASKRVLTSALACLLVSALSPSETATRRFVSIYRFPLSPSHVRQSAAVFSLQIAECRLQIAVAATCSCKCTVAAAAAAADRLASRQTGRQAGRQRRRFVSVLELRISSESIC